MPQSHVPLSQRADFVPQVIHQHSFANGLVLVAEPMDWVESAAFNLLLPAGCLRDPPARSGLAAFTCEMTLRGCGPRDSRQFIDDLENLGVDRSSSVSNAHTSYGGAMIAEKLPDALQIFADLVQQPHLPNNELEDARQGCLQEVRGVNDDLAQRVMQELRRVTYADPFGRSSQGTIESVSAISLGDVRQHFETTFTPQGAILSVAGRVDWNRLRDTVEKFFGHWKPRALPAIAEKSPPAGDHYLHHDSSQTHIALSYPSVPYSHPDYFDSRAAVGIMSDGMSSRLFTEVREKRGLVYTVYATLHSLRDRASVMSYAGTSAERAQETLDVLTAEFVKLAAGVTADELARLKARIKSNLIMQQESSGARSAAIAGDWYYLGRVRTLEEISRRIDAVTVDTINAHLRANPPRNFAQVTLGPQKLETPRAVS